MSISARSGHFKTVPLSPSWSAWSHGATAAVRSVASRTICSAPDPVFSETWSRLGARRGEAEPVDDVVEAGLEQAQQVVAGDAALLVRLLVVGAELRLEEAVVAARLLLLPQLQQILALLDAAATVLTRRIRAALDGAFLGQAALALQKELDALPAALLAFR